MNLFVGNLSFDTQDDGLRAAFAAHGIVDSARVVTDRISDRSRGFGFVEMPNANEAQEAIAALNGSVLGGREITVNEARPRSEHASGRNRW